ncbi:ribonucleotide-diphosphate reductase subunit beta [Micavibrio aeruginosavorus]|uniref:ribonucleotide-diphosphate reductase subunit beta n=1 Tax=Micavibrio aeruginosavorus TaxID=349221 RepID=UPI00030C1CCD|nr:ribonucleotide-diphosphate reductase subunit beta [Micavibrio aeruginosavorus]
MAQNVATRAPIDDVTNAASPLLQERHVYKPFLYPWCYEAWLTQQRIHWIPEEVPLAEDVRDWKNKLTAAEKTLLTQIFRFFTQSDVEVNNCYMKHYSQVFGPVEVQMMLSAFSNIETVHIAAYSHLLDTIGMPEIEYSAFMKYKEMKDKFDYMQGASMASRRDIAKTMAMFGAFTEGLQLFASFAILMNFPRFNKMKGMGQIVTWSVRDETLHCLSMIKLFNAFIAENKDIWDDELKREITESCKTIVGFEDAFIDLAFEGGEIEGLTPQEVKNYIRYIGDRRLQQLNLDPVFGIEKNPLPWMDIMLNGAEHANFFENRATEYSRASTEGAWEDVFDDSVFSGNYGKKIGGSDGESSAA